MQNERISSEEKVISDDSEDLNSRDTSSWQETFSPQSQRRFSEARENIEDYYLQLQMVSIGYLTFLKR